MGQIVDIPGQGPVEFPDGMSDAEIVSAIKRNSMLPKESPEKKSTTMDVVKSVASAVPKAAANIVGLPSTIQELMMAGARKVGGAMGLDTRFAYPTVGNPGDLVKSGYEQAGLMHQPETPAGRYAGAGVEGALSAPGSPLMMFSGMRAGLGSELGGDLTGGSALGKLTGGLLIGAGPDLYMGLRGRAGERVAEATKGMSPADWEAALARQKQAQSLGIQVTGPEAIGNKNLLSQQLLLENAPKTSGQFETVMKARPGQVENAVAGVLDDIGPRVQDPGVLGSRVQTAAKGALDAERKFGNIAAGPYYAEVTSANKIPIEKFKELNKYRAIREAIDEAIADPANGIASGRYAALQGKAVPPNSLKVLDAAKKKLDAGIEAAKEAGDNARAGMLTKAKERLISATDEAFPGYAEARNVVARNAAGQTNIMESGPIGQLAKSEKTTAQFSAMTDAKSVTPEVIKMSAGKLKMQSPDSFRDLVRQGLQNELDDSLKMLQTGGQEFSGARFARSLRETPQTRANIEEMLRQLPDGGTRVKAFNNLLDTLELTGNRLPVGSRTAFNQLQLDEMSAQGLTKIASNPVGGIAAWWDRVSANMTGQELAKVFTDKDSVKKLRELAFTKPGSAKARSLIGALVSVEQADD